MQHPSARRATRTGLVALLCLSPLTLASCAQSAPAGPQRTPSVTAAATTGPATTSTAPTPAEPTTTAPSAKPSIPAANCAPAARRFLTRAPGKGRTVALTFDDGPGPADAQILEILDRYRIRATFFETGAHAAADPNTVRLLAEHGNLIAAHSWDHDYPTQVRGGWSLHYLLNQFTRTDRELSSLAGTPICFVRPPGGFRTNVVATADRLNLTPVLWSTDSQDWRQPPKTTAAATKSILTKATTVAGNNHPIVLMHSTKASHEPESQVSSYRGNTIAALPQIIDWYRSHGYRFVRMDATS